MHDGRGAASRHRVRWFGVTLGLLLFCLRPSGADGQVVHGRVVDAEDGEPIAGATVRLVAAEEGGEEGGGSVLTDRYGIFRIPTAPGVYVLTAERIGYGSSRSEKFELARNEIIELVARLTVDPIGIEPVQVVGEREPALEGVLVANGFYERRRDYGGRGLPFAQFFTRDELQIEHSAYLTDVFNWIPAVRIVNGSGSRASIELLTRCRPTFYVDGVPVGRGGGLTINEVIDPRRIVGVEIYPGIEGPHRFRDVQFMSPPCGSVVVWSDRER